MCKMNVNLIHLFFCEKYVYNGAQILLGVPICWYVAPTIINTFLDAYDFSGKKIVIFATSGGSGFGNTVKELQSSASDAVITEGRLLNCGTKQEITEWVNSL